MWLAQIALAFAAGEAPVRFGAPVPIRALAEGLALRTPGCLQWRPLPLRPPAADRCWIEVMVVGARGRVRIDLGGHGPSAATGPALEQGGACDDGVDYREWRWSDGTVDWRRRSHFSSATEVGGEVFTAGEFRSAIEVIDGGSLQRHGITEIGIAGYPDGHPRLSQQDLDRALADKINAAETTGLAVHIVTQFCFDPQAILNWVGRLRGFGIEHQVRIGLAGPTNLATLLRYAGRCGVRASAQGLARQTGLMRQLFAMSTPDALVRALATARADGQLGDVAPHFFSFGGLAGTARWADAVAQRRIALDAGEGFRVEPPR